MSVVPGGESWRQVKCPKCKARRGGSCTRVGTTHLPITMPHQARRDLARVKLAEMLDRAAVEQASS